MLHYLKEFGKYAEITGYRNIKFSDAEAFLKAARRRSHIDVDLQFFDADLIATPRHLYFAVLNALQAFQNKTSISKSLAVETMLYTSAQRQIQRAIGRCGIKPQTTNLAVVAIGDKPPDIQSLLGEVTACVGSKPDEAVLELTDAKLRRIKDVFGVKAEEIASVAEDTNLEAAVVNLVVERVALLATQL